MKLLEIATRAPVTISKWGKWPPTLKHEWEMTVSSTVTVRKEATGGAPEQ